MELRDYQKKQLDFLEKDYSNIVGLESPTGTGKSIVLLQYVQDMISNKFNSYNTIVIATAYNDLANQIYCTAKDLFNFDNLFYVIGGMYERDELTTIFRNTNKKVIITNHAFYIYHKNEINADLLIIDECHIFPLFYEGFMSAAINDLDQLAAIDCWKNNGTNIILKNIFETRKMMGLPKNVVEDIFREISTVYSEKDEEKRKLFKINFCKIYTEDRNHKTFYSEDVTGINREYFFNKIDVGTSVSRLLLTSATIDTYTMRLFGLKPNNNRIYKTPIPNDRFKNSNIYTIASDFKEVIDSGKLDNLSGMGMILCTSNADVIYCYKHFKKIDRPIFKNIEDFKKCPDTNKILVGSKKYFNGVSIDGLSFVILNKIPFDKYDDRMKSYCDYIEMTTHENSYVRFVVPRMENNLLQMTGRLWRKNDYSTGNYDDGDVYIFDERFNKESEKNMSWVKEFLSNTYKGISVKEEL